MRLVERTMDNIRKYIDESGYKKVWIAKRLDISRQNLDKILKNEKNVTLDDVEAICDVLNIKVEDVMKEDFEFFHYPERRVEEDLQEKIAMCGEFSSEKSRERLSIIEEMMGFIKMLRKLSE